MKKIEVFLLFLLVQFATAQTTYSDGSLTDEIIKEQDNSFYVKNTTAYSYTDENGAKMSYRLFLPAAYNPEKKYPLILSFHGAGSRGNDNLKQLRPWVAGWMNSYKASTFVLL